MKDVLKRLIDRMYHVLKSMQESQLRRAEKTIKRNTYHY